jgi:hypothetical protein
MKTPIPKTWLKPSVLAAAICLQAVIFSASGATIFYWYNIGPQPLTLVDSLTNVIERDSGRVTCLAVDPSNSHHWLIGAAQGGIWETFNEGATLDARTDDQASMAMGAIAFAPGGSVVYAGTGEANFRGDAYAGAGLLVSQDGGTHWGMLNSSFAKTAFSRIRVNPLNLSNLVVATARSGGGVGEESSGTGNVPGAPPRGIFISTDGGNGFTQVLTGEATALEANPNNFCLQYAALGEIYGDLTNGVYRTTNCWASSELIQGPWQPLITNFTYVSTNIVIGTNTYIVCTNNVCYTNNYPVYTNVNIATNITVTLAEGRIVMASSALDPNVLYVGIAHTRSRYLASLYGIWVTTNAWDPAPTWTALPDPPIDYDYISTPRFWYMFDLLVDPYNPATVYLAEFNVWRFQSSTWTSLADWGSAHVHPDNHVMVWVPTTIPPRMLLGNDGGIYLSDPGVSGSWSSLNAGLRITQFYKGAVDPTGLNVLALGGAQDNFTTLYTGGLPWPSVSGGDGGDCAVSSANPLNDWALSADTPNDSDTGNTCAMLRNLLGYSPGSGSLTDGADDINDVLPFSKQFYVHFEKAPFNDDLFIAGTARLWRCNNFFTGVPSWSPNSPTMLDGGSQPIPISAMAFAPSANNGMVYAFGTEDGQLRITSDGGSNWSDLDPAGAVPNRYVSGLAFSPVDTNVLYVALSGFNAGTPGHNGHLFKTVNAFASPPTWTDVSPPVDLPNNCIAIDPNAALQLWVGTDQGVWSSSNGGGSWGHYGPASGMPNVAVYDLRFNSKSQPTAFTHGRGAYLLGSFNIPILVIVEPNPHLTPNCLTCPPDRIWLNPGDEVTVEVPLQGVLPVDTVALQATLLPSAQIRPITGTQDYGVVKGQGPPVSRVFRFIAGGAPPSDGSRAPCGGTVQAVFQLTDAGVNLGQVALTFHVGMPSHPLVEDFEQVPPPVLPPGWTTMAVGNDQPWSTSTNPPPTTLDMGEDTQPPQALNTSAVMPDWGGPGGSFLTSPPFPIATAQAQLYFRQWFDVPATLDGAVLEIAIGTQPFADFVRAGGSFVKDGYNAVLSDHNPLGPRPAWSGKSGGWLPVLANLPASAAGQNVQLRWNFASYQGGPSNIWFVDSVKVTEPLCLPPVTNPVILNPALRGNFFTFAINTVTNRTYIIQYKTNLDDAVWQVLETLPGNGSQQTVISPIGPDRQRFFRFLVE